MTVFVDVAGRGPNLALLHGWGMNGAVWNGVRDVLAERFTLHIVDLPGHGNSQGAAITTISAMADAVANAIPARTHLLGWSLGGQIALEMARRHPDRIDKLLLVATTPRFLQGDSWPHAVLPKVLDDFGAQLGTNVAATIRRFLALQVLSQPNMRETMLALQEAVASRGSPDDAALAASLTLLRSTDLREQLPHISHPALVLQGDYDTLTPEAAGRKLAEALPNARYAVIERAAHAPFLSHRDAFLRELDSFLSA